jgi:hypothetical protein
MQLSNYPQVHTTDDLKTSEDLVEVKQITTIRCYQLIALLGTLIGVGVYLGLHFGLLKSSDNSDIRILAPLVKPPVDAACPATLKDSGSYRRMLSDRPTHLLALNSSELKNRFFSPGPANMFKILKDVDERIGEINLRFSSAACMMGHSHAYNISTWGTNQTLHAQCTENMGNTGYFYQWVRKIFIRFIFNFLLYYCINHV